MRYNRFPLILHLIAMLTGAPLVPQSHRGTTCFLQNMKEHFTLKDTEFQTFRNEDEGEACLRILKSGRVVFQRTNNNDGWFELGQKADIQPGTVAISPGTNITGNGLPDVIVDSWTGGAHCCRTDYVFELRPAVKLLAIIQAQHADQSYFVDLDHNNQFYYITADWAFAYWYGSFAGSPVPEVVLQFAPAAVGGAYHLALDKMARPAPTTEEWDKASDDVQGQVKLKQNGMAEDVRTVLWQEVVNLIYTGHPDLAWKFVTDAGPEAVSGDDPDVEAFCGTLKTSLYWPDLKSHLGNAPAACLRAKPKAAE